MFVGCCPDGAVWCLSYLSPVQYLEVRRCVESDVWIVNVHRPYVEEKERFGRNARQRQKLGQKDPEGRD